MSGRVGIVTSTAVRPQHMHHADSQHRGVNHYTSSPLHSRTYVIVQHCKACWIVSPKPAQISATTRQYCSQAGYKDLKIMYEPHVQLEAGRTNEKHWQWPTEIVGEMTPPYNGPRLLRLGKKHCILSHKTTSPSVCTCILNVIPYVNYAQPMLVTMLWLSSNDLAVKTAHHATPRSTHHHHQQPIQPNKQQRGPAPKQLGFKSCTICPTAAGCCSTINNNKGPHVLE